MREKVGGKAFLCKGEGGKERRQRGTPPSAQKEKKRGELKSLPRRKKGKKQGKGMPRAKPENMGE